MIRIQSREKDISRDRYNAYYEYIQELREGQINGFSNPHAESRRPDFLNDLIQHQFDNFLSQNDLDLLDQQNLDIQNKTLIRVPYYYGQEVNQHYQNVHVEAKGVHYVHIRTGANTFYVGLGERGGSREVGYCGKCCVEFGILEVDRNPAIIVYRTADYPSNIPEGVYAISPNIDGGESRCFDQRRMIEGSLKYYIEKGMKLNQEVEVLKQERVNLQQQVTQDNQQIQDLNGKLETKEQEAEELKKEHKSALEKQDQQFQEERTKAGKEVENLKKQLQKQEQKFTEQQLKHKHEAESKKELAKLKEKLALELQAKQEQLKERLVLELQEKLENSNHLKQADKCVLSQDEDGQSYSLHDSLVAVNSNMPLLDRLEIESVITADIDLKAIDVKEDMPQGKAGRIEFFPEHNHAKDHGCNIQLLIEGIESGRIGEDTVIAIERKSYGENLGMSDVVLLASIIEHSGKNPDDQLQIPEEFIKDSLIYHDALLYKTAREHGVKLVGIEGRNLKADKNSPGGYDQVREEYMAGKINQLTCKGYNVIVHVGVTHVDSLRKLLESFAEIDVLESSRWYGVLSEVTGTGFVDRNTENFDVMTSAFCAYDYLYLLPSEIELMGDYTL